MSVGSNLQEMENVVTKGASPAEPMQKLSGTTPGQTGSWEDLGGPTPENYRPDDDSAKTQRSFTNSCSSKECCKCQGICSRCYEERKRRN